MKLEREKLSVKLSRGCIDTLIKALEFRLCCDNESSPKDKKTLIAIRDYLKMFLED
jgi:hypothetical protein